MDMNNKVCLGWPLTQHVIQREWRANEHYGIDLRAPEGTPVFAAEDGEVERLHAWNGIRTQGDTNSYGNMIKLKHNDGMETLYAHLSKIEVAMGQPVVKEQQIGLAGNTGNSFGSHLHFEVWQDGSRHNPLCFLDSEFTCTPAVGTVYGPGECAATRVEKNPTQIRCIGPNADYCEVFAEEDVCSVVGKLEPNEVCKILNVGDTVTIGNMQSRWYKVERNGQAVYCLYLPDRCRLE